MNKLLLALVAGGGAVWLYNLNKAGERLNITLMNGGIEGISGGALKVWAKVAIDNPSNSELKIIKPYLHVYLNEERIGNSIPSKEVIVIEPNKRTIIERIRLQVPLSNLPFAFATLFTKGQAKAIGLEVLTTVNGMNYRDYKTFSL